MDNLWPEINEQEIVIETPLHILRIQAEYIGKITKNIIVGEVNKSPGIPKMPAETISEAILESFSETELSKNGFNSQDDFIYRFDLVAPSLGNYRFNLFIIRYSIKIYPMIIYLDSDIAETDFALRPDEIKLKIQNEEKFIDALKIIFASSKTQTIVKTLLSHVSFE